MVLLSRCIHRIQTSIDRLWHRRRANTAHSPTTVTRRHVRSVLPNDPKFNWPTLRATNSQPSKVRGVADHDAHDQSDAHGMIFEAAWTFGVVSGDCSDLATQEFSTSLNGATARLLHDCLPGCPLWRPHDVTVREKVLPTGELLRLAGPA